MAPKASEMASKASEMRAMSKRASKRARQRANRQAKKAAGAAAREGLAAAAAAVAAAPAPAPRPPARPAPPAPFEASPEREKKPAASEVTPDRPRSLSGGLSSIVTPLRCRASRGSRKTVRFSEEVDVLEQETLTRSHFSPPKRSRTESPPEEEWILPSPEVAEGELSTRPLRGGDDTDSLFADEGEEVPCDCDLVMPEETGSNGGSPPRVGRRRTFACDDNDPLSSFDGCYFG